MPRNSVVGLDIGSQSIHVAQVTVSRGSSSVVNFGGVELPHGAVREGEILDVDAVSAAIKQLMASTGIKEKKVWVGVANQRVVVRQIDVPYVEEAELRSSLRFQVQEYIPIPVEDAELDFHVLEEIAGEGGSRMLRLLLVAAHKDMVASHIEAAIEAGLKPTGVDLNSFALLRSLAGDRALSEGGEVLIDVGAGVTNIVVHDDGVPRFVRILVLGGQDITDALASGLGISPEDAEAAKIATGMIGGGDDATDRIIQERADQFIDEVRGSLDYYQAQSGSARITRVVLAGGGSKLAGLVDRLGDVLRLPVEMGRPFAALEVKGTVFDEQELAEFEPLLATSVGLALGGVE